MQYIQTSFLSFHSSQLLPPPPLFPQSTLSPFPFRKNAELQKKATIYKTRRYNKTRRNTPHRDWAKHPNRWKRVPQAGKKSQRYTSPHY